MKLAAQLPIPDNYWQKIEALTSGELDPSYRFQRLASFLRGGRRESNILRRNRVLVDVAHALCGDWSQAKAENWDLLDLSTVRESAHRLRENPPKNVPETVYKIALSELGDSLAEAERNTFVTFDEFRDSEQGHRIFSPDQLGEYSEWFRTYLPYIGLELPEDEVERDRVVSERVEFFVGKRFHPLAWGSPQDFIDRAWGQVYSLL